MMKIFNTDKHESQTDSDKTSFGSAVGRAKSKLLNLSDGGIEPKPKTARMLLPVIAICLVFVLGRVFDVSSPQSAISEPTTLIEHAVADVNSTVADTQIKWRIPEMYPNQLGDSQ